MKTHARDADDRVMAAEVVGREFELGRLEEFLGQVPPRGALLLSGGPGIGKTTLWRFAVASARGRRLRVLHGRPSPVEPQPSWSALIDLFDGVDQEELAAIPSPQRRALEVALLRAEPSRTPPEDGAIALGYLNALRGLAAGGALLIAIDDVQWLDARSAAALVFAAERLQEDGVAFLLAGRADAPTPLERTLEARGLTRLEVGPLSLGATRRMLSTRFGLALPRRVLRDIHETARGNPLFALEIGRTLTDRSPPEVGESLHVPAVLEDLLGTRVLQLPKGVCRLLLATALSPGVRISQLIAIADQAVVDTAVDAGILLLDGNRVRPVHPLLAAAARGHSRPDEVRLLHLELARAVEDEELRARHLALGTEEPDEGLAVDVAAAAARASRRGAVEDAVELAEHAVRLTPPEAAQRADRLLALVEYLLVVGEPQRAADLLAPEADALPTASARVRAHLLLADSRFAVAHVDEYGDHLERALVESEQNPALRATVMARKSRYAAVVCVERIRDAESWALEALPAARAAGPDVEREVLHGLGWARSLRGLPIDDLCERFVYLSTDAPHIFRSLERLAAERHAWRGEMNQARTIFLRLLALADDRRESWSYVALRLQLGDVELRAGEWETATRLLDEWNQSPDRELLGAAGYERCRALLAAGRGHPGEAERWAAEAIACSEASGLRWNHLEALRARGIAALLAHDPARAAASLRTVWEHTRREGVDEPGVFPVAPDLVEALVELEEPDEAWAVTGRLRRLAEEQGHPWALATAQRCESLLRLAAPPYDHDAARSLADAAGTYGELGLRFDRARSLLCLGRAQRRLRKWGAARASLEQAAAAFEELGSLGWVKEVGSELGRVGARRPGKTGQLTPAQRRVAELAVEGLSNKEIAAALFVQVHTVEVHLSHGYAKLGIRSRSQLANRINL